MSREAAGGPVRAAFAMSSASLVGDLFDAEALARLRTVVSLDAHVLHAERLGADAARDERDLSGIEVLITGWGAPRLDAALLARVPRLRAVVHAAGTVKGIATPELWARGVRVSTAAAANAEPVAEYTLAMVLLAGKDVLASAAAYRAGRTPGAWTLPRDRGNHGAVVGVVGASRIGRRVIELLRPFDVEVLLHDPYVSAADAAALGVRAVAFDELLRAADVVTLHAPSLDSTRHMVGARELALMRDGATLVNTARGALVDTAALTPEVLSGRLRAVLDVTDPEPLPADHPLFDAPGALLTPHVAGSLGNELTRLGASAVDEVERFVTRGELAHEVREADLATSA